MFEYDIWVIDKENTPHPEIIYFTSLITGSDGFGHDIVLAFDASDKGEVSITNYTVFFNMDQFNKCPEPNLTHPNKKKIMKAIFELRNK